jgi:hypothetical protein
MILRFTQAGAVSQAMDMILALSKSQGLDNAA